MDRSRSEQLDDIDYEPAPEENKLGHLLSTVNPDAAAAIDNPPAPPDVGTIVVFKGRQGFSRMHRTEFPAMVLGGYDDGTLELMVMMEPEDMMLESRVPFRSHNQDQFYWRYRRKSAAEEGDSELPIRIKAIEDFLRAEDKLGEIIEAIGKRVETIETVLASDEMEALEKRIVALEGGTAKLKAKRGRPAKAK